MKKLLPLIFILSFASLFSQGFNDVLFRKAIFLHLNVGEKIWGPNGSNTSVIDQVRFYNELHKFQAMNECAMEELRWPTDPAVNSWARWDDIIRGADPNLDLTHFLPNYKVIIFKTNFDASNIVAEGSAADTLTPTAKTLFNYKWHWRRIINNLQKYPDNYFVIWTNPPQCPGKTTDQEAILANRFAKWAKDTLAAGKDPEIGGFPLNIHVFDYFRLMADGTYTVPLRYTFSTNDATPNNDATDYAAPVFVQEVYNNAIAYEKYYNAYNPPVLVTPAMGAKDVFVDSYLKWYKQFNVDKFWVQVALDTLISQVELDKFVMKDTVLKLQYMRYSRKYFWRVKGYNTKLNRETEWSATHTFSTSEQPPEVPVPLAPSGNITQVELKPVLSWKKAPRATTYGVDLSEDSTFKVSIQTVESTADSFIVVSSPLAYSTKYFWRVKAGNTGGQTKWSDVASFVTKVELPQAPVQVSPEDQATVDAQNLAVTWTEAPRAKSYNLSVALDDEFTIDKIDKDNIASPTFTFGSELKNGKTYYWRVAGVNESGPGPWSGIRTFKTIQTLPAAPTLLSPAEEEKNTSLTPEYTWASIDNADSYTFELAKEEDFNSVLLNKTGLTEAKFKQPANLNALTEYHWRVKALNSAGNSPWSQVFSFTTCDPSSVPTDAEQNSRVLSVVENPVTNEANIRINLPGAKDITLKLYNSAGMEAGLIYQGTVTPGEFTCKYDTKSLANGAYYIVMLSDGKPVSCKMAVAR